MDQTGMWNLFFATGLPEAYLALRTEQRDEVPSVPPKPCVGWGPGSRRSAGTERGDRDRAAGRTVGPTG